MRVKVIACLALLILAPFHSPAPFINTNGVWTYRPVPKNAAESSQDPLLQKFKPRPAPEPGAGVLQKHDRLAICGDSITEQKMYSRIIEDYLTVCVPDLGVTVRQYGWSG